MASSCTIADTAGTAGMADSRHRPSTSLLTIGTSRRTLDHMATPTYIGPPEALAKYETLVAGNPAVERKGAKNPYTSRNGHMFSFLDADGTMALRLPPERYEEFLTTYDSGPVEQYGRTMRGYVSVPADLLGRTDELQPWFDASHEWIGTLTPKPTKATKRS